jgi:hypothetical protein
VPQAELEIHTWSASAWGGVACANITRRTAGVVVPSPPRSPLAPASESVPASAPSTPRRPPEKDSTSNAESPLVGVGRAWLLGRASEDAPLASESESALRAASL